jgi:aspartate kinase
MLELAASGAKVLMLRCVEYARRYHVPVHVRSSFSGKTGTEVTSAELLGKGPEVEQAIISGVAHDRSEAKVTVAGCPDKPGVAAAIFRSLATSGINIDMIVQVAAGATGTTDITFTAPKSDAPQAVATLDRVKPEIGFDRVLYDENIGKVSLIGAGMRSNPGVSARFFGALAEAGVNVEIISTSEIRISVVCRDTDVDVAVQAVHDVFDLGGESEATVYAGTGR